MDEKHIRFNENCPACCCKSIYIHKDCGGRWHERVVDDTEEDGWIHNYRCDKCNKKDYSYGYDDMPIEFNTDLKYENPKT